MSRAREEAAAAATGLASAKVAAKLQAEAMASELNVCEEVAKQGVRLLEEIGPAIIGVSPVPASIATSSRVSKFGIRSLPDGMRSDFRQKLNEQIVDSERG